MEEKEFVAKREEITQKRIALLDKENELWMNNCKECTLVMEAIQRGELAKGTCKDRPNAVCLACTAHHQIRDIGKKIEGLTLEERVLRKYKPKKEE